MLTWSKSEAKGYEQLTLLAEAIPANLIVLQTKTEKESKTNDFCGQNTYDLSKSLDRIGLLTKMLLGAYPTELFLESLTSWNEKDIGQQRYLYQLSPSVRGISGRELLSLPTPTASDFRGGAQARDFTEMWQNYEKQLKGLCETYSRYSNSITESQENQTFNPIREKWEAWKDITGELGGALPRTYWTLSEPPIPGVDDGIPNRMERSKCLGNTVVPQMFYPILLAIAEIERTEHHE